MARLTGRERAIAITDLLSSLQTAATPTLLFSRCIEAVRWYRCSLTRPRNCVALDLRVPVFSAVLSNVDVALRSRRGTFHIMSSVSETDALHLKVTTTVGDVATEGGQASVRSEWVVARGYGSEKSHQATINLLDKLASGDDRDGKLTVLPVPWAAVAAQVISLASGTVVPADPVAGRLCRISPLTTRLEAHEYPHLPWHVSAHFETGAYGDLANEPYSASRQWNTILLRDVVPVVVAGLLKHLAGMNEVAISGPITHSLLPHRSKSQTDLGHMCNLLVDGFWEHGREVPVLAVLSAPQPWFLTKHPMNAAAATLRKSIMQFSRQVMCKAEPVARAPQIACPPLPRAAQAQWMAPQDVCFLERRDSGSDALARCLSRLGMPICLMKCDSDSDDPLTQIGHGARIMDQVGYATIVTPRLVRDRVCEAPAVSLCAALDHNAEDCLQLLRFATSDSCDPLDLVGFPVPLSDGTTTRLQRCSVDANQMLFLSPTIDAIDAFSRGAGHRLIHKACAGDLIVKSYLGSTSCRAALNVQTLTLQAMRHELIPRCLPARWLAATGIRHIDASTNGEQIMPGAKPRAMEPAGWRCVVTDCGQLNPATILRCSKPHCPGQSSFATSALEHLYVHKPTPVAEVPSKRPWGELRGWAEYTTVGGVDARTWLNSFWNAIATWVPEHEDDQNGWDAVLRAFEDVALLPGINAVAYAVGARVPTAVFTPVIWLDRVRRPLNNLLAKLGGCVPDPGVDVPEEVLAKCVNPANGIGCLRVVSWCIKQHEVAEHTFRDATREERHALLRMLGAMVEYTPSEYRLIAQLPIVEVWDAAAQSQGKSHAEHRSFISVAAAVKRKEIFHSDGTANVWMKKGRSRRSLVLSRTGPSDQFNAGVVALLQACAESIMRDSVRGAKAEFPAGNLPHLSEMEIFVDDPPTKTLALAQRYRTRCIRDDSYVDAKTFMLKKRPQSAFSRREYPKPWLVGARVDDEDMTGHLPPVSPDGNGRSRDYARPLSGAARPSTAPPADRLESTSLSVNERSARSPRRSSSRQSGEIDGLTLHIDAARSFPIDESWPKLHQLCATGNPTLVRHSVRSAEDAEVSSVESHGTTPLIVAAGLGHLQVAKLLVLCGASVNRASTDETKVTPLFVAACNGHIAVCRFLVAYGAKIDQAAHHSRATPISIARANRHERLVDFLKGAGGGSGGAGRPNSSARRKKRAGSLPGASSLQELARRSAWN